MTTLMESSQSDLFARPPSSSPPPPPGAVTAADSSVQQHQKEHLDNEEQGPLEDWREGSVNGAEIGGLLYAQGTQQQEEEEAMGCVAAATPTRGQGVHESALMLEREGLIDVGGNHDEVAASQGVERFEYMPLVEQGEGFQFGQVGSGLGAGTDNMTVATASENGPLCMQEEEVWIAQGIDASNYTLGNDADALFEEAIREIINKSSQATGYIHVAEGETVQGPDHTQQLDSAPQASDSLLCTIEAGGVSGHKLGVGLPQDAGTSGSNVGGEEAVMSPPAIFAGEETHFVQTGEEGIDRLLVTSGAIVCEQSMFAPEQVSDIIQAAVDGSDSLQVTSWPIIPEQEMYNPPPQDAGFVLAAEERLDSPRVATAPQQIADNVSVSVPLVGERNAQDGQHFFSEVSKDDDNSRNGGKRKRDEAIDGADVVHSLPRHEVGGNVGVDDQDVRGTNATRPLWKGEVLQNGLQLLPCNGEPPAPSSGSAATLLAAVPRGQSERSVKQHVGNGVRVSFDARTSANAKRPENLSRDEKSGDEGQKESEGVALWVKWRGKWEVAIRCSTTDCPSTTLKAKPNYSKKKHVIVYFPSARLFSWVDTQHTCPISENPVPLLTGTHAGQREVAKDTNLPRRRMLLKLGGEMLDISDRLHIKAVVESSQNVNVWKRFAKEAASATTYEELGTLLVRLHLTIAPIYIKPTWMERRFVHWKEDCARAASAASLQKLTKELINAVLWEVVAPLWNAPEQPELDPEWEHWKGDAFDEEAQPDAAARVVIPAVPQKGTLQERQTSVGSGSKRFKEQARARRQTQLSPDTLESSQQKRSKLDSVSSEFQGGPVSSSMGHATTAFRSPLLVQHAPLWQDKKADASDRTLASNSGLCSAFLKKKNRRCNRLAKEETTYCGKHKRLANPENAGNELTGEEGLAWESGLCSASIGQEFTRCVLSTTEGSTFCQIHVHLAIGHSADKNGEVVFSAPLKEARCNGITTRGLQCTHKPRDGSTFCIKHSVQGTNTQDNEESETGILLRGSEGSGLKSARVPQIECQSETGRIVGSPLQIQVGQASSPHVILGAPGNGLMQRNVTTSSEVKSVGIDGVSRKRKWVSNFFSKDAAQTLKSLSSPGQLTLLPKVSESRASSCTRCKGRTTRNDEQCSFRARAGHDLCTKHLLASETPRKILEEDPKGSSSVSIAKDLLERYLKAAEGISPEPHGLASKKQLLKWTRAEAAQDSYVAEELLRLVTAEMSGLKAILKPKDSADKKAEMKLGLSVVVDGTDQLLHVPETAKLVEELSASMTCGLCDLTFSVQEDLGRHWQDSHRKEVTVFVKGYACQACRRLYSRKHTVRRHWRKRHQSLPVRSPDWSAVCAICDRLYEDHDVLLEHVCSEHPEKLTSPKLKNTALLSRVGIPVLETAEILECADCHEEFSTHWDLFHHKERTHKSLETEINGARIMSTVGTKDGDVNDLASQSVPQMFGCRICGKKFSLLSDLVRHKEVEHSISNVMGNITQVGTPGQSAVDSDSSRLKLPVRRKSDEVVPGSEQAPGVIRRGKRKSRFLKQSVKKTSSDKDILLRSMKVAVQTVQLRNLRQLKRGPERVEGPVTRPARKALYSLTRGGLMLPFDGEEKCENVPDDGELLDVAQSVCCQSQLLATLHQRYVKLPDQLFLRVSKICLDANVKVEWLAEGYLCHSGCKDLIKAENSDLHVLGPVVSVKADPSIFSGTDLDKAGKYCSKSEHLDSKPNPVILCSDLSDGLEPVPVVCVVDQDVVHSWARQNSKDGSSSSETLRPWDSFKYITKRLLDPSLGLDPENYKVGCQCEEGQCLPESCDHVYTFDNDNPEALDIRGKPMKGRFPYDEKGCIILEEGYLVYECNSSCHCQQICQNRVLQKGVTVKLEVFRTLQKGWAVRAAQMIPRGTFVCEYLGEVLHDQEANKRGERYDQVGCSYLYDIDAHLDTTGKVGRSKPFVIDATKHGNVARFINHSCAPNLVNYQVLVDSIDCQLAHIGLFASRDIQSGEELAYDYRYRLLPGKGCPCHCGAPNCRGRLY